jgi:hypothetical protein
MHFWITWAPSFVGDWSHIGSWYDLIMERTIAIAWTFLEEVDSLLESMTFKSTANSELTQCSDIIAIDGIHRITKCRTRILLWQSVAI